MRWLDVSNMDMRAATSGWCFRGRPRGFSVLCNPKRWVVSCRHAALPNGAPRRNDCRSATNSPAVSTPLTRSNQSAGNGTGQASNRSKPHWCARPVKLDHGHFSARGTSWACSELRWT